MKHRIAVLLVTFAVAECASADIQTLCTKNEVSIVDAWMGHTHATQEGWRNKQDGKLLSLCTDRQQEPFGRLIYRYGLPGSVELEVGATKEAKFKFDFITSGPQIFENVIFFSKDNFTYYISIADGQGSGVSLNVFNGKKRVFKRFSGNTSDDFSLGAATMDFAESRGSSILKRAKPLHDLGF
jgi:hypothetical protein